ncbi:MAG TPA: cytidylate kinase-like family protein [Terriglobia bacterium]|nr:cytidylate kinase-like family protein [Terriglobia bacterium]
MGIRVITLEREYGSGGGAIARKLASRLGWKLWDHLLTQEIARRMDCECRAVEEHEERRDPAYYRLLKTFLRGSIEGSLNAPRLKMVDTECVREVMQKFLPELADAGEVVIVGRGSAYYLGSRPDAFHVFIYAPFEERVRRLLSIGKSEKEAIELGETVDRDRAAFIKRYFNIDWPGRHQFHLMVNSGMGEEVAVEIILDAITRYEKVRT